MTYAGAASAALGALLFIINRPASRLYNGSFVCGLIGGFFETGKLSETETRKNHYVFFIISGAALAACAAFLSPTSFLLIAGGVIGGALVLYRPEIGVYAAAFLLPIAPTKIILGVALAAVISLAFHVIIGRIAPRLRLLDFFVLLFAASVVYSVFISYRTADSVPVAAIYLLFILFFYAVRNVITERKQIFAVISLILVSGLIVSAYGIFQRLTGSITDAEMWLDPTMFENIGARVYSTLENPNVLGEYLIFVIILALAAFYYFKKPFYKIAAAVIFAAACACIILTLSRGAWVGLFFAFFLFMFLNDKRLIFLAAAVVIIAPAFIPQSLIIRLLSIGNVSDTSTNFRLSIWMASLLILKSFWPSGIGLGTQNFTLIYAKYAYNAVYAPHSHNLFLQIFINLGIAGFIVFICFLAVYFKNMITAQRQAAKIARREANVKSSSFEKILPGALFAAMAGYLVQGMTDNVWYNYRIICFFWLIIALSGAAIRMTEKQITNKNEKLKPTSC